MVYIDNGNVSGIIPEYQRKKRSSKPNLSAMKFKKGLEKLKREMEIKNKNVCK